MTPSEQITKLNSIVKVRIAPSKIHGVGVFALRDIFKEEKLYADEFPQVYTIPYSSFDKLFKEVRELLLERWPQIVNGSKFAYPDTRIVAYMNHGYADEVNYDAIEDRMLKDVKIGEEITENYRLIPNYKKIFAFLKEEPVV